jgi:hypothetical protein
MFGGQLISLLFARATFGDVDIPMPLRLADNSGEEILHRQPTTGPGASIQDRD